MALADALAGEGGFARRHPAPRSRCRRLRDHRAEGGGRAVPALDPRAAAARLAQGETWSDRRDHLLEIASAHDDDGDQI
ncbi:MAG: hypothetical protein JO090_02460 [Rhizobacter sp.]|nr:hypothetical protein [Rhizobacter sp.]